jgi:hypothetical protein
VRDLDSKYRPHLEAQLEGGEELRQRDGLEALAEWFRAIDT